MAEFNWIEIVARQYGEQLSANQIQSLMWNVKMKYLKRNPVTVARQIDYTFRQLWDKVIYGGKHPIGQVLNYDERGEFNNWGTEHMSAPIHVLVLLELTKIMKPKMVKWSVL